LEPSRVRRRDDDVLHFRDEPRSVTGPTLTGTTRDRLTAIGLFVALMIVYNANGREIGSYDTQPTELAARELPLPGTLRRNHVVGQAPAYAERGGFSLAADGSYRSV